MSTHTQERQSAHVYSLRAHGHCLISLYYTPITALGSWLATECLKKDCETA